VVGMILIRQSPFDRFFVERDPALSYPYSPNQSVSVPVLIVVAVIVPMIIVFISQILFHTTKKRMRTFLDHPISTYTENIFMPHLAMIQSVIFSIFITLVLKSYVGRLRPNFFAMCNYKGYRNALISGNFTAYDNLTVSGAVGSLSHCWETDSSVVHEAQYSFPSGHASLAFSGLIYLSLFLYHITPHSFKFQNSSIRIRVMTVKVFILLILFMAAALIAGSRTRDYWHNFDDIFAGSALGCGCALLSFWLNYEKMELEQSEEEKRLTISSVNESQHV